jgi:methylated-DNA-[protein]-cysteine S-methyltransferase
MRESDAAGTRPVPLGLDRLQTPIGELLLVFRHGFLCALDYADFGPRMEALLTRRFERFELVAVSKPQRITSMLARYFGGQPHALEAIRVDAGGTPYARRVWAALRTIPAGQTRTYGEFAVQLGGTHARAVGRANSLNPVAIVVPCHRVIGADASLTGYAGGLHRKRWLLDHESSAAPFSLPF